MRDDRLNVSKFLRRLLRVLAHEGSKECAQCRDKILHLTAPVRLDRVLVEDAGAEHIIVGLHRLRGGDKSGVELETVADILALPGLDDAVQDRGELVLD